MNKHLQQLIEVANLDKEIDALEPKILEKRAKLDRMLREKASREQQIQDLQAQKEEINLKIRSTNNLIEETGIHLEHIAKKHHEVKSERELKALNIEEELAKEQLTKANQDIEVLQKDIQLKDEALLGLEVQNKELDEEIKQEEISISKEIDVIKKEQEALFHKKQSMYEMLDQKLAVFYEKIRKWAKNTSVVLVKKQACGGCFIKINDRVFAEIKQSNDIVTCPHCGRILYIES
ncbi:MULTISPECIES: zinc ribbon domain-containing protein [unclassified Helicobacter]|uniref:zinc ribbon domain-containing protein n=1 Tax=unclassified Helicobacter TaxID=2593540 RepID=UPI000CF082C5|nr:MULTISPECIES: C4-type zinc ribbon domain-containing protein [unclassified Helicobacter]